MNNFLSRSFGIALVLMTSLVAGCAADSEDEQQVNEEEVVGQSDQALALGLADRTRGEWKNGTITFTSLDEATGAFTAEGDSSWTGTLKGTTWFTMKGKVNFATGDVKATFEETFTGKLGSKSGTIRFVEKMVASGATGETRVDAVALGGTGGFARTTGYIRFVGFSDPSGAGAGTYDGVLVIPRR